MHPNEVVELLQFCASPKLRLEKRVWREINKKSNQIKPIEDKLKKVYVNVEFSIDQSLN